MKLIAEVCETVKAETITESLSGRSYYISGPFLQAEVKNRNGRIYPIDILSREVARYTKELIDENRALGELGHPDSPNINLDRVSHIIVELRQDGNDFIGRAKIMDTPNGRIVKALIDDGVKLGVSSRGLGSLRNSPKGNVVGEDFYLATAADIVADPSAPNAFVRGIMEGKEWVWNNGRLTEAQVAQMKRELEAAPKKQRTARKLTEAKVWQKFFESVKIGRLNESGDEVVYQDKLRGISISDTGFEFLLFINGEKKGKFGTLDAAKKAAGIK